MSVSVRTWSLAILIATLTASFWAEVQCDRCSQAGQRPSCDDIFAGPDCGCDGCGSCQGQGCGFFTSPTMTGDWCGLRSCLQESGVTFAGRVTQFGFGVRGGIDSPLVAAFPPLGQGDTFAYTGRGEYDLFDAGVIVGGEVKLNTNVFDLPGEQHVGGIWKHVDLTDLQFAEPPPGDYPYEPVPGFATLSDSYTIYYGFDQYFKTYSGEPPGMGPNKDPRGWGMFGRASISDGIASRQRLA